MTTTLTVMARPLAPRTPNGKPGAYGLWEALVTLPNGSTVWGGGVGEVLARSNALRNAEKELAEVKALLNECDLEADAAEAGDLEPRE